jgi:hypothetical protein
MKSYAVYDSQGRYHRISARSFACRQGNDGAVEFYGEGGGVVAVFVSPQSVFSSELEGPMSTRLAQAVRSAVSRGMG